MSWHRVGHRGAPRELPPNTLLGFQRAIELGCTMVECDVRLSRDGVVVLSHDESVVDVRGTSFVIERESAADLGGLDLGAGEGVPTLAELARWAAGRCAVMADMKCETGDVERKVVDALSPLANAAKLIPGAGPESRERFRALDPELPLSLTMNDDTLDDDGFDRLLPTIDTAAVTWRYPMLSACRLRSLHGRGFKVFAWTVDDKVEMNRLIDIGVDGIISNRPDLLCSIGSRQ